jgi:hypothetical protein
MVFGVTQVAISRRGCSIAGSGVQAHLGALSQLAQSRPKAQKKGRAGHVTP